MVDFPHHTLDTASDAARPLLEKSHQAFGRIPGLHAVMAEAPTVLEAYQTLIGLNTQTRFTTAERHVAWLSVSFENGCAYCMAAHTGLARMDGVDGAVVHAVRDGTPIADARLEALRRFTLRLVAARGWADDADVEAFLGAGFTKQQVLELVLIVSTKTLSNYVNHLADTPVDAPFQSDAWRKPASRAAE